MRGNRIRNRGYLPHWEAEHGIYFVTFRLADSLPQSVIRALRVDEISKPKEQQRMAKKLEDFLDRGAGACVLSQPCIAGIVASALKKFNGVRYRMLAWCVMPNHVHVVFQPLEEQMVISTSFSYGRKGSDMMALSFVDSLQRGSKSPDLVVVRCLIRLVRWMGWDNGTMWPA